MPRTKANLKSRKVNLRATRVRTRKNIKHTNFLSRKERIAQAAIAGAIIQEQVLALQAAGVIPAAAGAAAVAPNPLDQVLNLDQGLAVLHGAADQAADPVPLHRQINAQALNARRRIPCEHYFTVRDLMSVFMGLSLAYYASFPLHAAPRETSLFDKAASHLSLAGTVTGFLSLPGSGILSNCAFGVKEIGRQIRNYNASTGRFPNVPGDAERRMLNVLEYHPNVGTTMGLERVGGIAARTAYDAMTGRPVSLYNVGSALFSSTYADVYSNVAAINGTPEENAMKKAVGKFGSTI